MDNRVIVTPIWSRILLLIIDLILIIGFLKNIAGEGFIRSIIGFGFLIVILTILTISSFTVYQFGYFNISVKYLFGIIRKYDIYGIIGYAFFYSTGESSELSFRIYFENKTLYIMLPSNKSKNIALEFFEDNYERIKNENIEKIANNNMEIKINKRKKYIFCKEYFEQIKNTKRNIYYYSKDISKVEIRKFIYKKLFEKRTLIIQTYSGEKIKLDDHKCKGGIGLFEYLEENVKCGNCT